MTLLTTIQNVTDELGITTPTSVINSTSTDVKQLLALANRAGKELRDKWEWPQLTKVHTLSTVDSQANYALPGDFDRFVNQTQWDRTNFWELIGPVTPQYWQWRKSGVSQTTPRREFRVYGMDDDQFYIHPTPDSSSAGETLAFEYQSSNWVRPKTWVASTAFAANAYCWNDGNVYQTTAGGTTGATAPTHTSGSASDDTVTWTYISAHYEKYVADTDIGVIDEELIELDIKWRFMHQKGLQFELYRAESMEAQKRAITKMRGSAKLDITKRRLPVFITSDSIPDTGFGS